MQLSWLGPDAHFRALLGQGLSVLVSQAKEIPADEIVYSRVVRAARRAGFQPSIEDVGVWLDGEKVSGVIRAVPFQEVTTALDRLWARVR